MSLWDILIRILIQFYNSDITNVNIGAILLIFVGWLSKTI